MDLPIETVHLGTTSITFACEVRNLFSKKTTISIDKIVFVLVDEHEWPMAHGRKDAEFSLS